MTTNNMCNFKFALRMMCVGNTCTRSFHFESLWRTLLCVCFVLYALPYMLLHKFVCINYSTYIEWPRGEDVVNTIYVIIQSEITHALAVWIACFGSGHVNCFLWPTGLVISVKL